MALTSLLVPEAVLSDLKPNGKKQLLQELAQRAAEICGVPDRLIFDQLLQRERLGSTGIGQGVAIPHAAIPGLAHLCGLFARLGRPVDFESVDGQPVDLVFVLLAPETAGADHLQALSRVARFFRSPAQVQMLRQADDPAALFAILTSDSSPRAA
ncbi:MAG: PTS IIA-like nitrogen-regulatory protein PtsN [Methylobacterium sp.]|nr:MAG: PTS IIA-like nitrogen-regulatory protein PtsN [Methylobacterium sp.]